MATRTDGQISVKAFLSHRYKSPDVNIFFYRLLSDAANVQFEVDRGTGPTNVTRLERMIRDSQAFIGLFPLSKKPDQPTSQTELLEASRYFRLEIDIALRARKPMLIFFDQRYEGVLELPASVFGFGFDLQEVEGKGGSTKARAYRRQIDQFLDEVDGAIELESARRDTSARAQVGLLVPGTDLGNAGYSVDDLALVNRVARTNEVAELVAPPGPLVLDGRLRRWLQSLDWLIADVGEGSGRSGLVGYLHGEAIPTIRLWKGVESVESVERDASYRGLFGGVEVGFRKDIVFWTRPEVIESELRKRIVRLREPVHRISTQDDAEQYFRSASLRNEAVFVSYSGRDQQRGKEIAALLKLRFQTVFDYRDGQSITPGQPWLPEIFDRLAKSALAVPLISPDYLASGNCEHELREMVAKQDAGKMLIVPVKLTTDSLHLPSWMQDRQYLRLSEYRTVAAAVDKLVDSFDKGIRALGRGS